MGMKITAGRSGYVLAENAVYAKRLFERIRGLIGRRPIVEGEALVIPACRQVHTFFMRFPIDVVFADREGRVMGIAENLSPFSFSGYFWKAHFAVELPAGTARRASLAMGGLLLFKDGR
jgi:uncharacterized membrane protein (UPF0127 family)